MNPPKPIIVDDLFPPVLSALLELLSGLSSDDWNRPTCCPGWTVKDIAAHLLGGEIGILSRKRDGHSFSGSPIMQWDKLVELINDLNKTWVTAASRLSPRVLTDLLKITGEQVCDYFKSLDAYAIGGPVDWASQEPAPVWLDLAREYTERWHHQQQIRDAVGKPGLKEPKFFAPLLDTFVRALPRTYREVEANEGTLVVLSISGDSGGRWGVIRENGAWCLYVDPSLSANAEVIIDQDAAWRLFTRGIGKDEALNKAKLIGDHSLGMKMFETVSVIA